MGRKTFDSPSWIVLLQFHRSPEFAFIVGLVHDGSLSARAAPPWEGGVHANPGDPARGDLRAL